MLEFAGPLRLYYHRIGLTFQYVSSISLLGQENHQREPGHQRLGENEHGPGTNEERVSRNTGDI